MGRWEPDAQGRLRAAALELYAEQGFDDTTVAQIADRAGVTERTFFRYFADKREVLFEGSGALVGLVVLRIADAPADASPLEAVGAGMIATAEALPDREYARQRAAVIAAETSLQERELLKLSALGDAAAAALRERGIAELPAALAADAGVTIFRLGFQRWITDGETADLPTCIADALEGLKGLTRPAR